MAAIQKTLHTTHVNHSWIPETRIDSFARHPTTEFFTRNVQCDALKVKRTKLLNMKTPYSKHVEEHRHFSSGNVYECTGSLVQTVRRKSTRSTDLDNFMPHTKKRSERSFYLHVWCPSRGYTKKKKATQFNIHINPWIWITSASFETDRGKSMNSMS